MHDPVRGISLRALLPTATWFGADDIIVQSCAADSRTVQPGDLFAALVGSECDGHDFVHEAAFRGASAVLTERYVVADGLPVCVVDDARSAFSKICHALAGNASHKLKVIGVTGTSGKTSVVTLIASVLEAGGHDVAWMSGLGSSDSVDFESPDENNPASPAIAAWLSSAQQHGCKFAVLEVSSHALCQSRVAGISFDSACVTNVRRDHLDYHTTLRNYREAKSRLFSHLTPGGASALNLDDPCCNEFLKALNGPALTFGMLNNADVTAVVIERTISEQTFLLSAGSDTVPVRVRTIGDQHVYNCLSAATIGLLYDISLSDIARGLEQVEYIEGRMERIECGQPFAVFVDAARTPDALGTCLESLREVTEGRLICVTGSAGDTTREQRPLIGQQVEALADLAVITDDSPRGEDPATIVSDLLRGFDSLENVVVMHDRAKAICWALSHAEPGDSVVIAGRGHEEQITSGSHSVWFDDREVAREWLHEQAAQLGFGDADWRLKAG